MAFLPALLYALLMGAVPLIEVIASGRSPAVLLLLYWFETVLLLVTGTIRIVAHRRATRKAGHHATTAMIADHKAGAEATRRALGDANSYLRSYVGMNAIFTLAHGVFVLAILFAFKAAGPLTWQDARIALLYAIAVQGVFLAWDMPRVPGWSFAELGRSTGAAGLRVLVTQLGLILGMVVVGLTGSPWGLIFTFVALRALADASIAWLEGLLKRRDLPPGLARVLSRSSKQSPEVLEAEFDALKANGSEVEALLEQTIDEALRGPAAAGTGAAPLSIAERGG
jgi:hypothetical protein